MKIADKKRKEMEQAKQDITDAIAAGKRKKAEELKIRAADFRDVYLRALEQVEKNDFRVTCSFMEIYENEVGDLLAPSAERNLAGMPYETSWVIDTASKAASTLDRLGRFAPEIEEELSNLTEVSCKTVGELHETL